MKFKNRITLILFVLVFQFNYNCYSQFSKSGLFFWLRADSSLTMSGSALTSWNDVSGNNFNFPAVTSPTVVANAQAGFQGIYFDNANVISNTSVVINNFNAFIVYKKIGAPISFERLMDHNYSTGFWIGRNGTLNHTFGGGYKNTSPPLGIYGNFPDSLANICVVSKKNNSHSLYNGNTLLSNQTLTNFSPTQNNKITIGSDINLLGFFKGDIFEIIFFNDSISNSNRDSVINYLYTKYGKKVDLGPDVIATNFCTNTINAGIHFTDYLWSTGATTSSISANHTGNYSVIAKDIFGRLSYDTIHVTLPGNFLNDTTLCTGSIVKWNTGLPKTDYTFLWQDMTVDSLFSITQPGNYYVKITDSFSCSITTDTVKVTEDLFPVNASLGSDKSLCAGNSIYLTSGYVPNLSYVWNDLSTNDSLVVTNPGQYSVIVTNTNNCVAKDTITISIQGLAPTAAFSHTVACKNNAVSFIDNSIPPAGNILNAWDWNFGDNTTLADTSHLQNPFYTFADTGVYIITLTVYTDAGCKQTLLKTVHVYPKPVVNFNNNIVACKNDSTLLTSTITTFGYPTTAYNWNFGDPVSGSGNISVLANPKHLFSQQTTYSVTLSATNSAGCSATVTNTVAVRAQVTADFNYTTPCTNTLIVFQDNSIVPSPNINNQRTWYFGSSTSTNVNVTKQYTLSGVYTVTLTVTGINSCNSTIIKQINVKRPPLVSFSSSNFCSKDTITLTDQTIAQDGSLSGWSWKLDNTHLSSVQNPSLSITGAANHTIQLTATNSFGCKDSVKNTLTVFPLPVVNFSTNPAQYVYTNDPVVFIPNITNGNFYNWNISSTGNYSVQSPTVNFANTGSYAVTLSLRDNNNCRGTKTSTVNVLNRYLDLGIIDLRSVKNASNYMSVEADLANFGSMPITSFDINYQINNGGNIIETWNGILNSGNFFTYQFNAKTLINTSDPAEITCVTIQSVNGVTDANLSNNNLCKALDTDNISILNPYPNPTDDNITLPVILNRDAEYTIQLFDALGQIVMEKPTEKGVTGLNLIKIQTDNYRRGCYLLKITINDKIYLKKFLKNSGY